MVNDCTAGNEEDDDADKTVQNGTNVYGDADYCDYGDDHKL